MRKNLPNGLMNALPQLNHHPEKRGCQEILRTDKFVVPTQAGTQEQVTEIPGFPLHRNDEQKAQRWDKSRAPLHPLYARRPCG